MYIHIIYIHRSTNTSSIAIGCPWEFWEYILFCQNPREVCASLGLHILSIPSISSPIGYKDSKGHILESYENTDNYHQLSFPISQPSGGHVDIKDIPQTNMVGNTTPCQQMSIPSFSPQGMCGNQGHPLDSFDDTNHYIYNCLSHPFVSKGCADINDILWTPVTILAIIYNSYYYIYSKHASTQVLTL